MKVESTWGDRVLHDSGVRAIYDTHKGVLQVVLNSKKVVVNCLRQTETNEQEHDGPIPKGLYLIDVQRFPHPKVPWNNLHHELADGTGFHGYFNGPHGRSLFAIHPDHGSATWGTVRVEAKQWQAVAQIFQEGLIKYKGTHGINTFCGFLTVI